MNVAVAAVSTMQINCVCDRCGGPLKIVGQDTHTEYYEGIVSTELSLYPCEKCINDAEMRERRSNASKNWVD